MACGEIRCAGCGQQILSPFHACPAGPAMVVVGSPVVVDDAFLAKARVAMKKCQVGVPKGPGAYDALHDILADCYGTIGRLISMAEGPQTIAEQPANAT